MVAAASLLAGVARADVISMPDACPAGSTPGGCHGPETCRPLACTADTDCTAGLVCREQRLCTTEHCCSGRCCGGGCGTPPEMATNVVGACGAGDACADPGATCQPLRVCVEPAPGEDAGGGDSDGGGGADGGPDGGSDGGCCSVASPKRAVSPVLFAALLGLLAARRRRRRG